MTAMGNSRNPKIPIAFVAVLLAALCSPTTSYHFWQITDVHYDRHYRAGVVDCCAASPPRCCHCGSPMPFDEFAACERSNCSIAVQQACHAATGSNAGLYGTRKCDAPATLLDALFAVLGAQLDNTTAQLLPRPDFVLWTGDNARHNNDAQLPMSPAELADDQRVVAEHMLATFTRRGVPVLPAVGNNDVWPHNTVKQGPNAVLDMLLSVWLPFLAPLPGAVDSFAAGGYYYADVSSSLRVVVLNTIYFFPSNAYATDCSNVTAAQPTTATRQLHWLARVLASAANRSVIVCGHVPPAFWFPACQSIYADVLFLHRPNIIANLFGHLHSDVVFFLNSSSLSSSLSSSSLSSSSLSSSPTFMVYCAPSFVPSFNPSVRSFTADTQAGLVDWQQFYYPISSSASQPHAPVQLVFEYSPLTAYQLPDLSPAAWLQFFARAESDPALRALYHKHRIVSSPDELLGFCLSSSDC